MDFGLPYRLKRNSWHFKLLAAVVAGAEQPVAEILQNIQILFERLFRSFLV